MLPITDRFFTSRSPFFYQDDSRTFFIVPKGQYTSDSPGISDELTIGFNTVPLELPGIISSQAMTALGSPKRTIPEPGTKVTGTIGEGLAALRGASILAPQPASVRTRHFLPLHWEATSFRFENFYHPYACLMIEQLNRHGIDRDS